MARKFKKGDVVSLKSGGPEMTVSGYKSYMGINSPAKESDEDVNVVWFNEKNEKQTSTFHQDTLESKEL